MRGPPGQGRGARPGHWLGRLRRRRSRDPEEIICGRRKILQIAITASARSRRGILCILQTARAALPALRRLRRVAAYPARYVRQVWLLQVGLAAVLRPRQALLLDYRHA